MAAELKSVDVDIDNYNIIQMTKDILGVDEKQAGNVILEIGLFNILHYPCAAPPQRYREVDQILSGGKYPELVKKIKCVWQIPQE